MKKIMILIILTGLYITLQGCIQNEALYSPNVTELKVDMDTSEMLNDTSYTTEWEVGIYGNEVLDSGDHVTELEMDAEKIEMLKLDKQYLLASNGKKCLLEINTQKIPDQFLIIELIINEKANEIEHNYVVLKSALIYVDLNGVYRIILNGMRGNDNELIEIYKITETGVEKEDEIAGMVKEILENGEIRVDSRQFLVGFQDLTATYKISNDGSIKQTGEFGISNDTFLLVKNIEANLYNPDMDNYVKTEIKAGERLTFYKTDMKDKLYFERNNGDNGYIEMQFIDTYQDFSVNGLDLVDYFDKSELSWAG